MAAKKKKKPPTQTPKSRRLWYGDFDAGDLGTLDAALYATYAGEASLGLVECWSPPATTMIQDFVVDMREVQASPSSGLLTPEETLEAARSLFVEKDRGAKPLLRVIGRIFDELNTHRGKPTCSVSEVFKVLLEEIPDELPTEHQQLLSEQKPEFFTDSNSKGYRNIDNRVRELRGQPRKDDRRKEVRAWIDTASEPKRGVEVRYRLNKHGQWLFDGWPAILILAEGRNR